jgi:16S rRNA (cytidine1402-2'-O)-methyltransferase
LTKINEEVLRTTLGKAVAFYAENDPRGEYVLVVEGCGRSASKKAFWAEMSIREHVEHYLSQGLSRMDAIKQTAKDRGVHKNEIYREVAAK